MSQARDGRGRWARSRVAADRVVSARLALQAAAGVTADTDPDTLARLAADPGTDPDVLDAVADHPNTPPAALTALAGRSRWETRSRVARHPNTPRDTLGALASDTDVWVRDDACANPNTPPAALADRADPETEPATAVRRAVARNPATPPEVVARLAVSDPAESVRDIAAARNDCPPAAVNAARFAPRPPTDP